MTAADILTAVADSDRTYGTYGANLMSAIANTAPDTNAGDLAMVAAYAAVNAALADAGELVRTGDDEEDALGWSAIIRRWEADGDPTDRVRQTLRAAAARA